MELGYIIKCSNCDKAIPSDEPQEAYKVVICEKCTELCQTDEELKCMINRCL